jgi:hypothetical protein
LPLHVADRSRLIEDGVGICMWWSTRRCYDDTDRTSQFEYSINTILWVLLRQ